MLVEGVKNRAGFLIDDICRPRFKRERRRAVAEYVNARQRYGRWCLPGAGRMNYRMSMYYDRERGTSGKERKQREQWDQNATTNDDWRAH